MNSVKIAIVLIAALAVTCLGEDKCSNLPKIVHDPRKTLEQYGSTWMLVKSIQKNDTCLHLQYNGNRNGNESLGTALFINKNNSWTIPVLVEVAPEMNKWTLIQDNGDYIVYRKLFINDTEHYWCIYACDESDKVSVLQCFARNAAGIQAIEEELKKYDLPMKNNTKDIFDVYLDSCKDHMPEDYFSVDDSIVEDICEKYNQAKTHVNVEEDPSEDDEPGMIEPSEPVNDPEKPSKTVDDAKESPKNVTDPKKSQGN